MQSCWKVEPEDRPNFNTITTKLSALLYEIRDYLHLVQAQGSPVCNGSDTKPSSNSQDNHNIKLSNDEISENVKDNEGEII